MRVRISSESREQQQSTDHVRGDERCGRDERGDDDDDDELSFRRRTGLNYYVSTSIRFEEKLHDKYSKSRKEK